MWYSAVVGTATRRNGKKAPNTFGKNGDERPRAYMDPQKKKKTATAHAPLSQDVPEETATYGEKILAKAHPDHCQGTKNQLAGAPRATRIKITKKKFDRLWTITAK